MPGIVYQSFALCSMACDARDRAQETAQPTPDAYTRDATVAVILAAASTEAFINELTETILLYKKSRNCSGDVTPQLDSCAAVLEEVEAEHGQITQKYIWASVLLTGKPFDKGKNPFQDFQTLIHVRNGLMHLKPEDSLNHEEGGMIIISPSKSVRQLQQRGLARRGNAPGFNLMQTSKMAAWACDTSLAIIRAVLDMIPDLSNDPSWSFKTAFREYSGSRELRERVLAEGTPPGKPGPYIYLEAAEEQK